MMNNDQEGKQDRRKEAPAPADGLRRSRRLQNLPPPPPPSCDAASERKRSDQEMGPQREVEVRAGDDVSDEVEVSSKEVKVNDIPASGPRPQPILLENGVGESQPKSKVGGTISQMAKSSIFPSVLTTPCAAAAAPGMSEVRSSEESADEEEAHPCLFIENILDVVFNYLINQPGEVVQDVQNVRLVCKTWNASMTRLYRRTRPAINFDGYSQRDRLLPYRRPPLAEFVKTMRSSQMIPVQKFLFQTPIFRRKNLEMFREFLLLCGPEVVFLSISIESSDAERIMANLENLPNLEMMKLKSLEINIRRQEGTPDQDKLETGRAHGLVGLTELLLTAAKNLWKFQFNYPSPSGSKTCQKQQDIVVAQQLSVVVAKRISRTVKHLTLDIHEPAYGNLAEMGAKLERVDVEICVDSFSGSQGLYKFLQSQATTLKHLDIGTYHVKVNNRLFLEFPHLAELVHLELSEASVVIASPSHFAETFPKLSCLDISVMDSQDAISTLLSTVQKPAPSLSELHWSCWEDFIFPAPLVNNVARSFPCLAELHMGLRPEYKETLVEVFKYLDSLELLHIFPLGFSEYDHLADSLLSGIPESDCYRVRSLQDLETVDLNELQRQPSIRNLTKLKTLVIDEDHDREYRAIAFTDISAFVFLGMVNLREIYLTRTAAQFSPEYLDLLRDKLIFSSWGGGGATN